MRCDNGWKENVSIPKIDILLISFSALVAILNRFSVGYLARTEGRKWLPVLFLFDYSRNGEFVPLVIRILQFMEGVTGGPREDMEHEGEVLNILCSGWVTPQWPRCGRLLSLVPNAQKERAAPFSSQVFCFLRDREHQVCVSLVYCLPSTCTHTHKDWNKKYFFHGFDSRAGCHQISFSITNHRWVEWKREICLNEYKKIEIPVS